MISTKRTTVRRRSTLDLRRMDGCSSWSCWCIYGLNIIVWYDMYIIVWYVWMDGWMLGQPGCQEHCFHPTCFFHSNSLKHLKTKWYTFFQWETWTSKVLQQLDSFTSLKIRVFPASNTLPARYRMRLLSWCLVHCPRGSFCSHAMVWRRKWKIGCLQD